MFFLCVPVCVRAGGVDRGINIHFQTGLAFMASPSSLSVLYYHIGEVWGRPCRNIYQSDIPKFKAYLGPLPEGERGVEFFTPVPPDKGCVPKQPTWSGSPGEDWVKIPAVNIKNTQT